MKYAVIVMIVLYLIIYGCSPDSPEKKVVEDQPATTAPAAPSKMEATTPQHYEEPAAPPAAPEQKPPTGTLQQPSVAGQVPGQVMMPCGQMVDPASLPEGSPCLEVLRQIPDLAVAQQDLDRAMQKMVKSTNEMVLATRQLVLATQQMLQAERAAGGRGAELPADPAQDQDEQQPAWDEQLVMTMEELIYEAREMVEATSRAISTALEGRPQQ